MKKIATTALAGLAAVVLSAAELSAQACNGTAPFSAGRMRVGTTIWMPDNGTIFDGEFAVSSSTGLYGGAMIRLMNPDNALADNSTAFGGFLGKPMAVDAKKTVEMCPQGFVLLGENSSYSFGGGVSFGRSFKQTSFDVVPFGAAFLSLDDPGSGFDGEFNLALQGGAGFVLGQRWTIRPIISIPLTNNGDATFGIGGFLNFGK